ncbi:unnamed protein product [Darwinula stevensoni]|uniref:Uncharacterized protein n=1 Tax=Darwinula stevensoni TaxID=69355 RepID=A0A7R8X1H7_9CRUS|nr:unnamed protein product [Darwinula stevensoni]CAG0882788.1 unnamed protein product [Darwinula stevensoni]
MVLPVEETKSIVDSVFGTAAVTLFRVAQGMGWVQRPGEKWEKYSVETNSDRSNVIVGTLVGLFVSNLVFSAACLLRLDFASIEALHGAVCAFLYAATGGNLIDSARSSDSRNGKNFVFASGVVCLLLGFSYVAVVLMYQKGRTCLVIIDIENDDSHIPISIVEVRVRKMVTTVQTKLGASCNWWTSILGIVALMLFRAAQDARWDQAAEQSGRTFYAGYPARPSNAEPTTKLNFDEGNIIVGTVVGLFLSTIIISLGRSTDNDLEFTVGFHQLVSAVFYMTTGSILIDNARTAESFKGMDFLLASGIVCLVLGLVYLKAPTVASQDEPGNPEQAQEIRDN